MKLFIAVGLGVIISINNTRGATTYFGPNYDQITPAIGSGAVNGGKLTLSSGNSVVSASFTKGTGSFQDVLVIFVDSVSGGFTDTTQFSDNSGPLQRAISGLNSAGNARSTANFASGFAADYAIVVSVNNGTAVFQLASGGSESLVNLRNLSLSNSDSPNNPTYGFSFDWANIGLPNGSGNGFTFETSYIVNTGSRSLESFESLTGASGFNTVNFGNYDTYGVVTPVPETTNAALAIFGGVVFGAGVFGRFKSSKQKLKR